ncbi:MAG: HAMP domain-containing histidine kinase [Chitinispirillaceae bacterium]|nr:HAMP domain-containing histidine kinase [Chitinispirillaceae bacterium]
MAHQYDVPHMVKSHTAAGGKTLLITDRSSDAEIKSDYSLLFRVLMNLLINALEASSPGEEVICVAEKMGEEMLFTVNNCAFINPEIQRRIFQQYFSTKTGNGRGFGTFGTKLICEKFLHGTVSFSTSETEGTHFRVNIPVFHS